MTDSDSTTYYAAVAASGVSVVGWLVAISGLGYFLYAFATDGPATLAAWVTVGGILTGALFAKLEHRLHDEPLEG